MTNKNIRGVARRTVLAGMAAAVGGGAAADPDGAAYVVRLLQASPPRFAVSADLWIADGRLSMSETYPAELPEMERRGWPALVSELVVRDAHDEAVEFVPDARGWRAVRPVTGRVRATYVVAFDLFAAAGWSSPLESAVVDERALSVAGRALFVLGEDAGPARVRFEAPAPWRAVVPWRRTPGGFEAGDRRELLENMIVLSTEAPDVIAASGFTAQIVAMGDWRPIRPLVRTAVGKLFRSLLKPAPVEAGTTYTLVLIPGRDAGGAAYRQSMAYGFGGPSAGNTAQWGNTIAHEIFHYWNSARLRGADYASTQWFQEGFTEYAANLAVVNSGIAGPDAFLAKLAEHVTNARLLRTTLEAIGTRKGPPLYSAGALVAFCWDVRIRRESGARRDLGDFFRALWRVTDEGRRRYAWPDIETALNLTAPGDWRGFYETYVRGTAPPPIAEAFAAAGLRLVEAPGAGVRVERDPAASPGASDTFRRLVRMRRSG